MKGMKIKKKQTREKFKDKMKELVNTEAKDLWSLFSDGVLEACKELCGRRKQKRERGSTWWWNEEVQEAIKRKRTRLERCARSDQRKIKIITKKREI